MFYTVPNNSFLFTALAILFLCVLPLLTRKTNVIACLYLAAGFFSMFIQARTAAITLIACFLFLLLLTKKLRWYWLVMAILCTITVFSLKPSSTNGRSFILNRTLSVIRKHPFGVGAGRFHTAYAEEQRNYFRNNALNSKPALLAGDVYFAFNEYLHISVEYGLIAGVLFFLFVVVTVLLGIRKYRKHSFILPGLICFFGMSVASLFFYLLHNWYLLALYCISVLAIYGIIFLKKRLYTVILGAIVPGMGLIVALESKKEYNFRQQLSEAERLSFSGYAYAADSIFQVIPGRYHNRPEYLISYGNHKIGSGDYPSALGLVIKAAENYAGYNLFIMLGDVNFKLGRNREAEESYLNAVFTMPSKFAGRKKIADFYRLTGNTMLEKKWLQSIIELPAKIPSGEVEKIKADATQRLHLLQTSLP